MSIVSNMQTSDWVTLCLGFAAFGTAIWSNVIARSAVRSTTTQRREDFKKEWISELLDDIAEYLSLDTQLNLFAINRKTYTEHKFNESCPSELVERMKALVENEGLLLTDTVRQKVKKFEVLNLKLGRNISAQASLLESLGELMTENAQSDPLTAASVHHEIVTKSHSFFEDELRQVSNS